MGVYDFFKGPCPKCKDSIDNHPEFGPCGDIQTKYFITGDSCFRDFFPGSKMPFAPLHNFIIGRTCCCQTLIKACFDNDILVEYVIAIGKEKFVYIQNERHKDALPQEDFYWFQHAQKYCFTIMNLEQSIIEKALHPNRIHYYVQQGHSIDTICSTLG